MKKAGWAQSLNQERIVFLVTIVLFLVFSLTLSNFLTASNMIALLRNVAVLGVLIVVLGRGIDLSMVAIMAISAAWTMQLVSSGTSLPAAVALGFGFAFLMSLISGLLIAYGEIQPLFATLAMGTFVYGFGRAHFRHAGQAASGCAICDVRRPRQCSQRDRRHLADRVLVARLGRIVEEFGIDEATEEKIMYAAVH